MPGIARAAGGPEATFPTSKHCRDFLQDVLSICHRIVMPNEINEEWRRHQSAFARRWLTSMYARRKVDWEKTIEANSRLRGRIEAQATGEATRRAMLKDCHLLEAAIATDQTIASLDDRVRQLFSDAAESVGEIRVVIWANPSNPEERCASWLDTGAEPEPQRRLGHHTDERS